MNSSVLKNKLVRTLIISFIFSVIVSVFMVAGFLNTYESMISDAFYTPSETDKNIVIIAIDDYSIRNLGLLPWPREYYAKVLENINQSRVIGIDIIFDTESNPENDSKLAYAIKENNVVLAAQYQSFLIIDGKLYGEILLKPNEILGTPDIDFEIGFVNLYIDQDGVVRSFIPRVSGAENLEHFSVKIVEKFTTKNPNLKSSRMLINYYAEPGGYNYIPFYDVYNKSISPSYFQDKIVLIGVTSPVEHDDYTVPISNKDMPGVEIHANLIQSILTRDYLYYQSDIFSIGIIILFALITGLLLYRFRIYIATIILAIITIVFVFLSIYYTIYFGVIPNILYPILTLILVYIAIVVMYYLTEERSRKWITSLFGKYVSPVVIDNLIKNPDKIKLGGEKRNITIFFSDIRGFTSISERLKPEDLVHLLNEYLTEMTTIITNDQGLVDKYMGDAIMAFWGAPLDQPNHAEMACKSSLEMIEKLNELQKKWKTEGIPAINIGIGINSGDAIVGNMGSFKRFDYTAMGDNVNLASRMEGLNKIYGTTIVITENTQKIIKEKFETRKLDVVKVKGKKKPILIYELIAIKGTLSKKQIDLISFYEKGLELYFKKKWKEAIKLFQSALKIKDDTPSQIFINRSQQFLNNSPPKDWDGAWEMTTK